MIRTAILLLVLAVAHGWAQPAPGRGTSAFVPTPKSPEVSSDGRVTFRLRAPNATEVLVSVFGKRLPMQKDEQGMWTVTTDPAKPDIYTYSFSVDGATFTDPNNPLSKTAYRNAGQSLFHVPGPVVWEPGDGPRGAVTRHFYKSAIVGDSRDFYVYTPPNYDPNRKEPYPVLYLLHGLSDSAATWIDTGAANVILDNLIAQGKAKPMLMVNPLGYGTPDMLTGGPNSTMGGENMLPNFANALLNEVMPQVEKAYRVTKDRNQRAIAGLSMGGAEALYTGLHHMDRFAWIGSFSGAFVMWPGDFAKNFPALDAKANTQLRLLWIACGSDDRLNEVNRQFKDWLKSKDIQFTNVETPGFGHVWPLWRQNLAELALLLFQAKGK